MAFHVVQPVAFHVVQHVAFHFFLKPQHMAFHVVRHCGVFSSTELLFLNTMSAEAVRDNVLGELCLGTFGRGQPSSFNVHFVQLSRVDCKPQGGGKLSFWIMIPSLLVSASLAQDHEGGDEGRCCRMGIIIESCYP